MQRIFKDFFKNFSQMHKVNFLKICFFLNLAEHFKKLENIIFNAELCIKQSKDELKEEENGIQY